MRRVWCISAPCGTTGTNSVPGSIVFWAAKASGSSCWGTPSPWEIQKVDVLRNQIDLVVVAADSPEAAGGA